MGANVSIGLLISLALIFISGFLIGHLVTRAAYRKYRVPRDLYRLALGVAERHERLIAEALPAINHLAQIAQKANMDEDAVKLKTLFNTMRCAIGMAKKLKDMI